MRRTKAWARIRSGPCWTRRSLSPRVRDIVGLYLNPPEAALVLCVDEKTKVQALDRTQPILPLLPETPAAQARLPAARHDQPGRGLDVASGKVISR
jgi:hypothetical protein